ncbi:MAG: hypothetical protein H7Y31_08410 [Chitinophagaceae bacterium]|nr:hypothetical protein [Chitinophagaceae bacterium]
MLFNLFSRAEPTPTITDFIWMTRAAKHRGAIDLIKKHPTTIVAAWFNQTINEFQQDATTVIPGFTVRNMRQLVSPMVSNKTVIVLEHYPLRKKELAVWQQWKAERIFVLSSLEDPLFQFFGGDKIVDLMRKMGMQENESVEHALVSKALVNAQQKLDKTTINESTANSQEEWFTRNHPVKS